MAEHLVDAGLLDVEDLAAQREDRLDLAIAAGLGRAAGALALDQEELAALRVARAAVGQLARQAAAGQCALAAHEITRLARRLSRLEGLDHLVENGAGLLGVLLDVRLERFAPDLLDDAVDFAVAELGLGLTLELRLGHLHADDGRQAFAEVVAAGLVVGPEQVGLARIGRERLGECTLEAADVRSAFDRADVVGVALQDLVVAVVELGRDLHGHVLLDALDVDHVVVEHGPGLVEALHELANASLEVEAGVHGLARPLVEEADGDALVEERQLAEAHREHVGVELDVTEDLVIGLEEHLGARAVRGAPRLHGPEDLAPRERLEVHVTVLVDLDLTALRQRIDHAGAHAVQAAGHLVRTLLELAARVQLGERHRETRQARLHVHARGNATPVIEHDHATVGRDPDDDQAAVARHGLVDRVVHDLVDQVVHAARRRVADVHARALANGFEALEDLDVVSGVRRGLLVGRDGGVHASPGKPATSSNLSATRGVSGRAF